jgi:hypothetical protein
MLTLPQALLNAAKTRRLIPFIGAGFSRVFNLPTWSELIDDIAGLMDFDPEIAGLYGDFLQLAEYLAIQQNGLGPLRSQLDKVFNSAAIDISSSAAHLLLPKVGAPVVYTTNWDTLIERGFDHVAVRYNKIVAIHDFLRADPVLPSIVKFHGDFIDDTSLVFTESSYFARLELESPLDIRFRSDILGRTLLFLGYSLSDINIRYIWFKLQKLLPRQAQKVGRDPFAYIVTAQRNPVFEEICKQSRDIGVIYLDSLDPEASVVELLQQLVDVASNP